ncbi:thiol:disulfide interchange protein precursor [Poriferisphaera corsica]|uniref:Thiol:disulfide interchange protein n=1 Tax=Poriferisphaera corsica TaxID=2528020 RepID=A0A517YSX6_9BACT|nr:thioredoxin family protein [Poriferisphaera corsica]QDU33337.1 thiol:disulfide interchange protein precursor [Poriferisphaera corsica]
MSDRTEEQRMKKQGRLGWLLLLLACIGVIFAVQTRQYYLKNNEKIPWVLNYEQGLKQARNSNIPAMIEFTSPSCPACVAMKINVFSDQKTADTITRNVIPIRLDITELDVQQANQLATMYEIWATPTYLILNNKGHVVARQEGAMDKQQFAEWVTLSAQNAAPKQPIP